MPGNIQQLEMQSVDRPMSNLPRHKRWFIIAFTAIASLLYSSQIQLNKLAETTISYRRYKQIKFHSPISTHSDDL